MTSVTKRSDISTPALLCDLDGLDSNIDKMAQRAQGKVGLRPHAKSHKSAFVARRQLDKGARGLSCAKLSEAEKIVNRLTHDAVQNVSILITSPTVGRKNAQRISELSRICDLNVVVDHPDAAHELSQCHPTNLGVLCDVGVGLGRTGVVSAREALVVAESIAVTGSLLFRGIQWYAGHAQHVVGRDLRRETLQRSSNTIRLLIDALDSAGYPCEIRSGGGTGTWLLDIEEGILNELQVGSYVFMDREYRDALGDDPEGAFVQSLSILSTVVSSNQRGFVTIDAGLKSMATDAGNPRVLTNDEAVTYTFFGDEHGMVTTSSNSPLQRGDLVQLIPPHCDPTVDKYDVMYLMRGDEVVDVVPVDARGCSQ